MNKTIRKIVIAVIALITIVSVSGIAPVSAQTPTPISAQIPAFNFTRNLTIGSTGEDVRALQQFLNAQGFAVATTGAGSPGNESTRFGPRTQSALARFQTARNISPARGFFGPITRARVMALATAPVTTTPAPIFTRDLTVGSTGEDVRALQQFLNSRNFTVVATGVGSPGNESTNFDFWTQVALTRFQSANNISPAHGIFDSVTRARVITSIATGVTAPVTTPVSPLSSNNPMTITASDLATALIGHNVITALTNVNTNTKNLVVWQSTLTTGVGAVNLRSLQLRQTGSIRPNDLQNFRLFVRGAEVGKATLAPDNTLFFDLSSAPVTLATGTAPLEVRADIISGSGRTFGFALLRATDFNIQDSASRANILATISAGISFPVATPSTGAYQISVGSLTVSKATNFPSSTVRENDSDVVIGRYTLTALGEPIRIKRLRIMLSERFSGITHKNITMRNVRLVINSGANIVQIGSPVGVRFGHPFGTTYELRESLTVVPGTPVTLEVRADIFDSEGTNEINSGDSFSLDLLEGIGDAQGLESLSVINIALPSLLGDDFSFTVLSRGW